MSAHTATGFALCKTVPRSTKPRSGCAQHRRRRSSADEPGCGRRRFGRSGIAISPWLSFCICSGAGLAPSTSAPGLPSATPPQPETKIGDRATCTHARTHARTHAPRRQPPRPGGRAWRRMQRRLRRATRETARDRRRARRHEPRTIAAFLFRLAILRGCCLARSNASVPGLSAPRRRRRATLARNPARHVLHGAWRRT